MNLKSIFSTFLLALALTLSAAPLTLVNDGKAASSIVIADDATEVAKTAAAELAKHLELISGAKLPIVTESSAPGGTKIYVGATKAAVSAGLGADKFIEEAWQIKAVDGNLFIAGGENNGKIFYAPYDKKVPAKKSHIAWYNNGFYRLTRRGPIYAVVKLLDKEFGVRWLWPGKLGTVIPQKSTITLPENYSLAGKPAFIYRKYRIGGVINAHLRNSYKFSDDLKILSFTDDALASYYNDLTRFLLIHQEGDSRPVPAAAAHIDGVSRKLFKKNPNMFAMREDGKRDYFHGQNRIRWCASSPDVEKYYLDTWDGGDWIGIGEGDTRGFCRCKACMALDAPQPKGFKGYSTTNRYIELAKRVRAKALKRNPNVKIAILMYMDYTMPPTREKDLSWMYGKFVPYGSGMPNDYPMSEKEHKFIMDTWNGWGKTGIQMNYRPNYLLTGYAIPALDVRQTGEMLRHAAANGMTGFDYDSLRGNWATKGPMLYMHLRLGTDPEMTVEETLKEYYSAFGPAAKYIEEYFNFWIDYTYYRIKGGGVGFMAANTAAEYYTLEVFEKPAAILEKALKAAEKSADKIYAERVKFIRLGLIHGKLCVEFSHLFKANKFTPARQKLNEIIAFRKQYGKAGFVDLVNITMTEVRGYKTLSNFIKGKFLHLDNPGLTAKKVDKKSFHKLTLRPSKWALSINKGKKSGTAVRKYFAGNNNHFVEGSFHVAAKLNKVTNKVYISFDDKKYTLLGENVAKKTFNITKYIKGKNLFYLRFDAQRTPDSDLKTVPMTLTTYRLNYALANPEEQIARPKVDTSGNWYDFNTKWGFRKDIHNKGIDPKDMMPESFDYSKWTPVDVPARLEATAVGPYVGYGFYGAKFKIPADWAARSLDILFHGVDEQAWVYINGKLVGEHSEKSEKVDIGVLWDEPFIIKVKPEDIRPGEENVIVVKIHNIKAAGGIWKDVKMRPVDASAYL